jgi:hypothetical protein
VRTRTVWLLARPQSAASRTRGRLVAAGTAVAGALALAALAVLRIPTVTHVTGTDEATAPRLSALVTETGLQPGVVTGLVLLIVPALALMWQALTTGSARRTATLQALRTVGATPADLRRLAAADAGVLGLVGGLLAGPTYLLLWLVLGAAVPPSARLLPPPGPADVLNWVAVAVFAGLVAAVAGALSTRARRRRGVRLWWRLAGLGLAVVAIAAALRTRSLGPVAQVTLIGGALLLFLVAVLTAGSVWVGWRARRLARSGRAVDVLAAAGLRALSGPAGRTAGAVFVAGIALGVASQLTAPLLAADAYGPFSVHLPGLALTAAAALLAALVAIAGTALAAADDLVTTQRALASTAALGASPATLEQVQRRRLQVVTVPPMAAGVLLGAVGYLAPLTLPSPVIIPPSLVTIGVLPVAVLTVWAACAGVVRALRSRTRLAADPSSLRVA